MTVNADPAELAKFSELAHRWWDPESEFRPLHEINPLRLDWIDVAGGAARQARAGRRLRRRHPGRAMARRGAQVTRHRSRRQAAEGGAAACAGGRDAATSSTARSLPRRWRPSSPQRFDVVTCMEMLEHVPDPASIVRGLRDAWSSPAAGSFFSTINRNPRRSCSRSSAPSTCCKLLPQGHARVREASSGRASSPRWCRGAGLELMADARAWNTTR